MALLNCTHLNEMCGLHRPNASLSAVLLLLCGTCLAPATARLSGSCLAVLHAVIQDARNKMRPLNSLASCTAKRAQELAAEGNSVVL